MGVSSHQMPALPEGLRYYLLRGTVMVPLVPVDQLPFQLQGIPNQLSHRQMSDENWKLLQETAQASTPLAVHVPNISLPKPVPISKQQFLAPDHNVRSDTSGLVESTGKYDDYSCSPRSPEIMSHSPGSPRIAISTQRIPSPDVAPINKDDTNRVGYCVPYPSGIEPDQSKKQFCTHWIKTGECAFLSVGCKYKHEMPTIHKLRELGFTQVPRWWKEKSAIVARGPTWMERRLASDNEDGSDFDKKSPPRIFPDPSSFRLRQDAKNDRHHSQSERHIIQEENVREQVSKPPQSDSLRSAQQHTETKSQGGSQPPNLLIDLDDKPWTPQPSRTTSSSDESCDDEVRSNRNTSLRGSPYTKRYTAVNTDDPVNPGVSDKFGKREVTSCHSVTYHGQTASSSSDTADQISPSKILSKPKINRNGTRRTTMSIKSLGLSNSDNVTTNSTEFRIPELDKNSCNHLLSKQLFEQLDDIEPSTITYQPRHHANVKGQTRKRMPGTLTAAKGRSTGMVVR